MISKTWKIFNDFETPEGKICIGLSGGLDSRVLAGIISKRRPIDLGFCYYTEKTKYNVPVVKELVSNLRFKEFEYINIVSHEKTNVPRAVEKLSRLHNLKDYTILIANHMDVITGLRYTKRLDREYYYKDMLPVQSGMTYTDYFKDYRTPFWNPRLVGYMQSLPRSQRFFQRAYREMIKKYLPDLWESPRCFETGPPVPLNWYVINRIYSRIFK